MERQLERLLRRKPDPDMAATTLQQDHDRMLLSQKDGALMARCAEVPELALEVERAVWQVERSISASKELAEEKAELEQANNKG